MLQNRDFPLAIAATDRGDNDKALELFRKALKEEPESALVHAHLAFCLLKLGKHFAASRAADQALALGPNLPLAHVVRATIDTVFGDDEAAKNALDEALRLDPENRNALEIRCANALLNHDIKALTAAVDTLLSLYPDDDTPHYFASRLATLRLDAESAERHARAALRIAPTDSANHVAIGWAFWVKKDFEKAHDAALSALALSPNNHNAHSLLAAIEMHRKPLTGWFHRIGHIANTANIKTAALYVVPAIFLYMSAADILRYFELDTAASMLFRGVQITAILLLISTQLYSRKSAQHQKAASLRLDY
ncbi:tetratricopeptide repeat protein [Ruegeria arenilitoris]|uniref:tetratricopeptide repeat protein n=1 Tax=Ruegeria arenilitoris TaxID=1173585 RepID=UPI00147C633D|nr:tetratricopeptide repeat protein [Ruegeria arenilitoris]